MVGGHLPKKIYVFLIMMKYDDLYFAGRYNFFTDCVEWYFLPKTEIKVFLKKMDIRGFGWRPSIRIIVQNVMLAYVALAGAQIHAATSGSIGENIA